MMPFRCPNRHVWREPNPFQGLLELDELNALPGPSAVPPRGQLLSL